MYKLIIADDEMNIRSGMAKGIPWENWGFTVSGTAADGLEVMELIAKDKPDVILSDIRMPNMDGVELMQYLNKNYPEIKIIILSGYSDFDYLNYSIKNNVTEYLLKPTDVDEFEELFKRLKKTLDTEREQEQSYKQSRSYHLDYVLSGMMLGYDTEDFPNINHDIIDDTELNVDNCVVALLYMEWKSQFRDEIELNRARQKIVDRINDMESSLCLRFFVGYQDKMTGILSGKCGKDISCEEITKFLNGVLDCIKSEMDIDAYACVSSPCIDRRMLPQCLQQTVATAHHHNFAPNDRVAFYHPVEADNGAYKNISFDYDRLMNSIVAGKKERAAEEIERVFGFFETNSVSEYSYIDNLCLELLFYLSRKSMAYNISFEQIMEDTGFRYGDLRKLVSLQAKKKLVTDSVAALIDCISLTIQTGDKNSNLAKKIKSYVDSEYLCNHISLEYISSKVQKSSAYVSRLFKDEYGCNFSEYITNKRLEKSREMLEDKSIKIYEIANSTGYADVSNFIKVFKKKYGISPGDYRNFVR